MNIELDKDHKNIVSIRVVGVGGGGGNAVDHMCKCGMGRMGGIDGVEFVSINTDLLALRQSSATYKLNIGAELTQGMGAGEKPEIGEKAARESREEITTALKGADMVFITAGMGGGTGTGAAPVIAEIACSLGSLTVGIVTRPFQFEGKRRIRQAQDGIQRLKEEVDTLLIIPNERLRMLNPEITFLNAFAAADEVLHQAVRSIADLITRKGTINLDFSDVTAIMKDAGLAHIGVGQAIGEDKVKRAIQEAIRSPLLETSIDGARGILVNFLVSADTDLEDLSSASMMIHDAASPEVNLIWGVSLEEALEDEVRVTIIATDFEEPEEPVVSPESREAPPAPVPGQEQEAEVPGGASSSGSDLDISDLIRMLNRR